MIIPRNKSRVNLLTRKSKKKLNSYNVLIFKGAQSDNLVSKEVYV